MNVRLLLMNHHITLPLTTFLVVANLTSAAPPPDALVKALTAAIHAQCPEADIRVVNDELVAKHGTMMFSVHHRSMTGEVAKETREEEGPNFKGFLLRVSLHEGAYNGQAVVPQDLKQPYWTTHINAPATPDKKGYYWLSFASGSRLDPILKQAILDTLPK